jgi:8-oxo-dGTP pyrophosphatase MutT (NUDIX family)
MDVYKRELVGIVIFDGEKFLLLHRVLHWSGWEFPKGGINSSETHEETIRRELFEETGINNYELISKIDEAIFFDSIRKSNSRVTNYLVRAPNTSKITFSNQETFDDGEKLIEHDKYKWFFPKEAVENVLHSNQKETLRKAIKFLGLNENV